MAIVCCSCVVYCVKRFWRMKNDIPRRGPTLNAPGGDVSLRVRVSTCCVHWVVFVVDVCVGIPSSFQGLLPRCLTSAVRRGDVSIVMVGIVACLFAVIVVWGLICSRWCDATVLVCVPVWNAWFR